MTEKVQRVSSRPASCLARRSEIIIIKGFKMMVHDEGQKKNNKRVGKYRSEWRNGEIYPWH